MVKHDLVAQKLATARRQLRDADEIFRRPCEEFLSRVRERDLACFYLFLAIQEAIDIAVHWVADADWGTPADVGETFDILRHHGVIDGELAAALRGATGLRNRIAHGYSSLEPRRIWAEYADGSAQLRRFLAIAAEEIGL